MLADGSGCVDLGESARFHKVLQGQEIYGFRAPYDGIGVTSSQMPEIRNHQYPEMTRCTTDVNCGILSGPGPESGARVPAGNSEFSYKCTGFGESVRFHKVLQGQEIFPVNPPCRGGSADPRAENCGFGFFEGGRPGAGGRGPAPIQGYSVLVPPSIPSAPVSSPSSVLMFQQTSQIPCPLSVYASNTRDKGEDGSYLGFSCFSKFLRGKHGSLPTQARHMGYELNKKQFEPEKSYVATHVGEPELKNDQTIGRNGCKLFGFSLTERIPVVDIVDDTFSASPTATEMNFETSSPSSNPHTPINSVGRSCTQVSTLHAVCAATPF